MPQPCHMDGWIFGGLQKFWTLDFCAFCKENEGACINYVDTLLRATDDGSRHTWAPGCHSQWLQHCGIAGRRNLGVVHLVGRVHAVRRQRLPSECCAHTPQRAEVHGRRVRVAAPAGRVASRRAAITRCHGAWASPEKLSCAPSWSVPRLPECVGVFLTCRVRDDSE